jgi:hypothetical protein
MRGSRMRFRCFWPRAVCLPGIAAAYRAVIGPGGAVDFRCQKICPSGIFDGLMLVRRKIEK